VRGLTPEERYLLIAALDATDPESDDCTSDDEDAVFTQMEAIGRGSEHLQELYDAATSGEWDVLLTAAEFRMVHREAQAS